MSWIRRVSRREFLKATGIAGSGLVLGVYLRELSELWEVTGVAYGEEGPDFLPNVFLALDSDGSTTIWVSRSEMGQGTRTGMPMILAEELDADWGSVRIVQADGDERYGHQLTGGSLSTRVMWDPLREAGATARRMLVEAAAGRWEVSAESCRTANGVVFHDASGRSAGYGELTEAAADLPVPAHVPLKGPDAYRILGTDTPRLDTPDIAAGRAAYGSDIVVEGMVHAAMVRCPTFGGRLRGFNDSAALAMDGVLGTVRVEGSAEGMTRPDGVAVVARDTWTALEASHRLEIDWDPGPNARVSSADLERRFDELAGEPGEIVRRDGDVDRALAGPATVVEASYGLPYLAHAPMEPMTCTVHARGARCEVWTPTQNPQTVRRAVAQVLSLPLAAVTVHVTLIGGGFGRRLYPDMEMECALVSREMGLPVKMTWSREEDIRHDRYRPASRHVLRGGLGPDGLPTAWEWHILNTHTDRFVPDDFPAYSIPNYRVAYTHVPWILPRGAWRATTYSQNPFVIQGFLDELAAAGGQDPLELRLHLLRQGPRPDDSSYRNERMIRVLERVGDAANWGSPLPEGTGRGVAFNYCYDSYVAQVAEVRMEEGGLRVDRVVCAVDCGQVTNPDLIRAQVEGGVAFGLSAALLEEITVTEGRVDQDNFHNFPVLRASGMPRVEAHIVDSRDRPGGMGETALTPIAGAVANAIWDASGERRRRLPLASS